MKPKVHDPQSRFSCGDVIIDGHETLFQGYFRVDRYTLRHRLFRDGWSRPIQREIFERGHAVAVLPYDPVLDSVVLIEQFRAGPLAAGDEPWVIEAIAGIVEDGESAEDVA
jgi:ADP-ribose pyrophosphatase